MEPMRVRVFEPYRTSILVDSYEAFARKYAELNERPSVIDEGDLRLFAFEIQ
jgi:hypothetical protein